MLHVDPKSAPTSNQTASGTATMTTHLAEIKKGAGQLKNVIAALYLDFNDLISHASDAGWLATQLPIIEKDLQKRLRAIFINKPNEKLFSECMLNHFFSFLPYLGFDDILDKMILPYFNDDFLTLATVAAYATPEHVDHIPSDPQKLLVEYLYSTLKLDITHKYPGQTVRDDKEERPATYREHFKKTTQKLLQNNLLLDPLLADKRHKIREVYFQRLTELLKEGVPDEIFLATITVIMENYDHAFLQFLIDWINENRTAYFGTKVERYASLMTRRIIYALKHHANPPENLLTHMLPKLNIALNDMVTTKAIFIDRKSKKESGIHLMISPLHVAVISANKTAYHLVVSKCPNVNPVAHIKDYGIALKAEEKETYGYITIDDSDFTPLHLAAQHGCLDLIPDLVARGADLFALTKAGRSVLLIAEMNLEFSLFKVLMEEHQKYQAKHNPENPLNLEALFLKEAPLCYRHFHPSPTTALISEQKTQQVAKVIHEARAIKTDPFLEFFQKSTLLQDPELKNRLQGFLENLKATYKNDICHIATHKVVTLAKCRAVKGVDKSLSLTAKELEQLIQTQPHTSFRKLAIALYESIVPADVLLKLAEEKQKAEEEKHKKENEEMKKLAEEKAATLSAHTKKTSAETTLAAKAETPVSAKKIPYIPAVLSPKEQETARIAALIEARKKRKIPQTPNRSQASPASSETQTLSASTTTPINTETQSINTAEVKAISPVTQATSAPLKNPIIPKTLSVSEPQTSLTSPETKNIDTFPTPQIVYDIEPNLTKLSSNETDAKTVLSTTPFSLFWQDPTKKPFSTSSNAPLSLIFRNKPIPSKNTSEQTPIPNELENDPHIQSLLKFIDI